MPITQILLTATSSGGGGGKSAALTSTFFEPLNEGQQQTIGVDFTNWDGSDAYWTVTDSGGYPMGGQVDQDSGTLNPGTGNSYQTFNFTFASDATTEGPVSYYIRLGSTVHGNEYFNEGPKTVRDSSQTPALVLDVDPASISTPMYGLSGWYNTEGDPLAISNGSKSANNGGTLVFNGTSTYVSDAGYNFLTNATYGTITLSAWIKPTAVTGPTQTIIAKELCYKIIIANDGRIVWMTAKGYAPWEVTTYIDAGIVTAGAWAQVVATVNADYTRIYINGVKITETTGNVIGANTSTFNIGAYDNTNDLFAGSMGEVKIWNYAITETTIIEQYNATADRYGRSPLPFSLNFPAGNPYLLVSNTQSDWNLGNTYTIEYWSKGASPSYPSAIRTVMSQGPGNSNIDLGMMQGGLLVKNSRVDYPEPSVGGVPTTVFNISSPGGWNGNGNWTNLATTGGTGTGLRISVAGAQGGYANAVGIVTPGSGYTSGDVITAVGESSVSFTIGNCSPIGLWTHVAYVRNGVSNAQIYYNGVNQTQFSMTLNNGGSDLNIGRRAGINGQGFLGKLAMIRISNTAKYLDNFSPSLSYGVESDTRLMLGSDNPLTDLSLYELNGLTTSGNNGGTIYFSKATYPNLNNQIRAGDTVVKVSDSTTSTVTGAVFTPNGDPDNWGVPVSPGWGSVSTVNFSGPGRHPISVQGAVTTSMDFPSFQSLQFDQPAGDFLNVAGGNDWNLGTTGTIEFWIKANNASSANIHILGGQWGLINQGGWYYGMPNNNSILIGLAGGNLSIAQSNVDAVEYTEPTAGVWTHVAVVYNAGTQKVYYNGVEQTKTSGNYLGNGWSNGTSDLYIGRLAPNYGGHFDGKLAMVRISSFAKYTEAFTATTTYGVEGDTRLFLDKINPTVDSNEHRILNNGVSLSSDFPT
jgi:hypothetical protein